MSRSYAKKYRFCEIDSDMKRFANKKVRKMKTFAVNGNAYKKLFCSWDICDAGKARPIETSEKELSRFGSWYRECMKKMGRK